MSIPEPRVPTSRAACGWLARGFCLVIALAVASCDATGGQQEFADDANREPEGFTQTDASGTVISEDADDWRTAPFFVGRVRVDPAFPNPISSGVVTVPVTVFQFGDLSGRITLRAEVGNEFRLLTEVLDASSPGTFAPQFSTAQLEGQGLHRVFLFDDVGELISYGDILVE